MPCYHPISGWQSPVPNENLKHPVYFKKSNDPSWAPGLAFRAIKLPCGRCIGCRLERSKQWAIRCVHEATLHDQNCFITLTYDNEHLPEGGTLVKEHYRDFIKRLRQHVRYREKKAGIPKEERTKIRFFHCGEYGDRFQRPHYHACIFGFDFEDKEIFKDERGVKLYISETLKKIWGKGHVTIGEVTFESAAYVARYITKKITGKKAVGHYNGRKPEYTTMSRRPGIASAWFDKFSSDVYPGDYVVLRGRKLKPPRFYDSMYEHIDPETFKDIKLKRLEKAKEAEEKILLAGYNPTTRRKTLEQIHIESAKLLKRGYEND